jgi:serine/threonine-protein kinase
MKPSETDPTLTPSLAGALSETIAATKPDAVPGGRRLAPAGYELGELLGRGGMGEVLLARDVRIDRNVAVKRMRAEVPTPDAVARFLREARIQARLDHPAIVPVHEVGTDADGRPYFTMKRLAGTTLADVLSDQREPLQKLLRVFVEVCLAIEFAHARGVIHRDLKPSNVMLGEYGEVYVLDWGVARVIGDLEHEAAAEVEIVDGQTQVGAVLGTPGYMSPEQVRGEAVTPATDVYALGSILFEILAGGPAHPPGHEALVTTLSTVPSPIERAPERAIPPELDAACVDALAGAPSARPTARALADRVQRFLDGDRDLGRRRTLASQELTTAREAANDPARRRDAMRAAGRALALDPESVAAAQLVSQLMLEPPQQLPEPLVERLAETDLALVSRQARLAALSMSAYLLIVPIVIWMGVRDWTIVGATFALVAINIAGAELMVRRPTHPIYWALITNAVMMVLMSRYVSSFVLVPGVIAGSAVSLIVFPQLLARPVLVLATFLGAFVLPFVLEGTGVWSSTWEVVDGRLIISSAVLDVGQSAIVYLIVGHVAMLIVLPLFVRSVAAAQRSGRRQLEIQAWHLGQLLPVEAPRPAPLEERCELMRR